MSTRKSHKAKRQWKRPAEPGNPESSLEAVGGTTSSAPPLPEPSETSVALVSSPQPDAKDVPQTIIPAASIPREQEYWYRTPDSAARKHFQKIAVLRATGRDDHAIAKKLGMTYQSVRQYVYLAKKNGWCDTDGEPVDLEAEMAMNVDRKLVRNLNSALDGGMTNWQTHEVTLELMKRRRVVSDVQEGAGAGGAQLPSVVAIQVVMPPVGAGDQQVIEANVGGVPAFEEGEVVGEGGSDV